MNDFDNGVSIAPEAAVKARRVCRISVISLHGVAGLLTYLLFCLKTNMSKEGISFLIRLVLFLYCILFVMIVHKYEDKVIGRRLIVRFIKKEFYVMDLVTLFLDSVTVIIYLTGLIKIYLHEFNLERIIPWPEVRDEVEIVSCWISGVVSQLNYRRSKTKLANFCWLIGSGALGYAVFAALLFLLILFSGITRFY